MPLASGDRLGPYEIVAPLGAGGMGEVYRARDSKLKREVAIKVLPADVASDRERLARFQREAEVLASLNHPHIAHVYGIEENALVMELVEGEDLSQRISHGAIPLDEALPIAKQIAEALEAAHDAGIIHRDLKPANVKVREDGTVKVLDFGLAKAAGQDLKTSGPQDLAQSPTITSPAMTMRGVILGTAAYMSPEQAKGKAVDKRADIWAFGCVLFEMLTGKRAFKGDDVTDIITSVMRDTPDWSALPAQTPIAIRTLLKRCLERDARRRLRDIGDARFETEATGPNDGEVMASPAVAAGRRNGLIALAAIAGAIIGASISIPAYRWTMPAPAAARPTRFTIEPDAVSRTGSGRDIAISHDGSLVAFVNSGGALMLRSLTEAQSKPLNGTEGGRAPFFSPDGSWVGFVDATGTLKKASTTGAVTVAITPLDGALRGATWLPDDTIIFATGDPTTGLLRVAAGGGTPQTLTTPSQHNDLDHWWPHAIEGRNAVLFTVTPGAAGTASTAMLDLGNGRITNLLAGASDAQYLSSGYLVFAGGMSNLADSLSATPFDLERAKPTGPPVLVAETVSSSFFGSNYDVSANGTLIYARNSIRIAGGVTLSWVDRNGVEESLGAPPRNYFYPRVSPDGTKIALDIRQQESDIWIWDIVRRTMTRLTTDPRVDRFPAWTRDSRAVIYTSDREDGPNVFRQSITSTDPPQRLSSGPSSKAVMSVTPDGGSVIVRETSPNYNLMLLPLAGGAGLSPLVVTPFLEQNGEVSPDGRWMAYEANESGTFQIYVRPFPNVNAGRFQISRESGTQPMWSRDGRELFFRSNDGIMSAPVRAGADWTADAPALVFRRRLGPQNAIGGAARAYDMGLDGRLLMTTTVTPDETTGPVITVVTNWIEELKQKAPRKN